VVIGNPHDLAQIGGEPALSLGIAGGQKGDESDSL